MHVEIIGGFLGSGKTTAILHQLEQGSFDPARTVVLVNEFGEIGVDGLLLDNGEDAVRELSSGCICCSLRADFVQQVEDIAARFAPERLVVEPSGVAAMRDILQALEHERIAPSIESIRTVLLLDPDDHDWFVEMSPAFVDSQVGLAQLILLNKADLAQPTLIASVTADLEERNPEAVVLPTTHGRFSWDEVAHLLPPVPSAAGVTARLEGFESYAAESDAIFDLPALRDVFDRLAAGEMGEVVRAKGVFRTGADSTSHRLDLATRRLHETPWPPHAHGRVNIIGRGLDRAAIERALLEAEVEVAGEG